jgi:dolichyl-phosphate beta-glucosyltransferase
VSEPYVSLVMPAYNEERRLPGSLERTLTFLAGQPWESELVVSDDGSTDATPRIIERSIDAGAANHVVLRSVRSEANRGKGAAIRAGMLDATGNYVLYLDADLATPPEEALKLLAKLEAGAPVAAGSRIQPDGSDMRVSQPFRRRLVGRVFTTMRKALRVLPDIDDTQCPMKGFRRDVAREVFARQQLDGWIFDAEVLSIARSLGHEIVSVPVRWRHVEGSRLRVRPSQGVQVFRDLLRLRRMHSDGRPQP